MTTGGLVVAAFSALFVVLLIVSVVVSPPPAGDPSRPPSPLSLPPGFATGSSILWPRFDSLDSLDRRPSSTQSHGPDLVSQLPVPTLVATGGDSEVVSDKQTLLAHVLQRTVLYRGVLLLSLVTASTQENMVNLVLSMHRVGLPVNVPLALCLDEVSYTYLSHRGVNAFYVSPAVWDEISWTKEKPQLKSSKTDGLVRRRQVTRSKTAFVYYFLKHGINVFMMDNDVVMVRRQPNGIDVAIDQLTSFASSATHIAVSMNNPPSDDFKYTYNSGFYLVRASNASLAIFESVVAKLRSVNQNTHWFDDQKIFNKHFKDLPPIKRESILELSWFQFCSGTSTGWSHPDKCCTNTTLHDSWSHNWATEHDDKYPYVLHFNMATNKLDSMKNWRVWFFDDFKLWRSSGLGGLLLSIPVVAI